VRRILVDLCAVAGVEDAEQVGEHLFLLVEGGVVNAGLDGSPERLIQARRLARLVMSHG
jgi:hypothetical protein